MRQTVITKNVHLKYVSFGYLTVELKLEIFLFTNTCFILVSWYRDVPWAKNPFSPFPYLVSHRAEKFNNMQKDLWLGHFFNFTLGEEFLVERNFGRLGGNLIWRIVIFLKFSGNLIWRMATFLNFGGNLIWWILMNKKMQ